MAHADLTAFSNRADALVARIKPLLAGHDPELQGAVLSDLVAIWVAGYRTCEPGEGEVLRRELLELHCKHVVELVDLYLSGET